MIGQSKNSSDAEMSTEDMSNKKKSKHLTGNNVKLKIRYHNNEKKRCMLLAVVTAFSFIKQYATPKAQSFNLYEALTAEPQQSFFLQTTWCTVLL